MIFIFLKLKYLTVLTYFIFFVFNIIYQIQKLKKFENTVMNERTFQIEIIKKEGRHDLHRMSSLITDPQQQPSKIILEQLTSDLQVRIEGSEKIVNVTTGKSFTKYRISVMVSILKAKASGALRIWKAL